MPVWDKERWGLLTLAENGKGELIWLQADEDTPEEDLIDPAKPEVAAEIIRADSRETNTPIAEWALKLDRRVERAGLKYGDKGTQVQFIRTGAMQPALMVQLSGRNAGRKITRRPNIAALRAKYDK